MHSHKIKVTATHHIEVAKKCSRIINIIKITNESKSPSLLIVNVEFGW